MSSGLFKNISLENSRGEGRGGSRLRGRCAAAGGSRVFIQRTGSQNQRPGPGRATEPSLQPRARGAHVRWDGRATPKSSGLNHEFPRGWAEGKHTKRKLRRWPGGLQCSRHSAGRRSPRATGEWKTSSLEECLACVKNVRYGPTFQ